MRSSTKYYYFIIYNYYITKHHILKSCYDKFVTFNIISVF